MRFSLYHIVVNWERIELRPLFDLLIEKAKSWEPIQVLPRTQKLGKLVNHQLEEYFEGKFRKDRNEVAGFFEAIERFTETGLPLGLDHFAGIVIDYKNRISPYPHYSGIKVTIPADLANLDTLTKNDIPELSDKEEDEGSTLTLM